MKTLPQDWITQGRIDFEYKKYLLLAYLSYVNKRFEQKKLYPFLSELLTHHNSLIQLRQRKSQTTDAFPKRLLGFKDSKLEFEELIKDDGLMVEINQIMDYGIERIEQTIDVGRDIFNRVNENVWLEPIGIQPIHTQYGLLMLTEHRETQVHYFELNAFIHNAEKYRSIHVSYLNTLKKGIGNTYEQMKLELIRKHSDLINPATFLINYKEKFPIKSTLIPIVKRLLLRQMPSAA